VYEFTPSVSCLRRAAFASSLPSLTPRFLSLSHPSLLIPSARTSVRLPSPRRFARWFARGVDRHPSIGRSVFLGALFLPELGRRSPLERRPFSEKGSPGSLRSRI